MLRRLARARAIQARPDLIPVELELCRRSIFHWWHWWPWTYNPKAVAIGEPAWLPFDLFPKQAGLVSWLDRRVATRTDGVAEKSRDVGFTWTALGWAWHKWRFVPGFKTAVGSRKEQLVDRINDPDSIFEKLRFLMRGLPPWMMPDGFVWKQHFNFMLLFNPETGNTIAGEAGDDMGRGGRSTTYLVDEGAFLPNAEAVELATSANSDVRIWGSTANGPGNLFYRKRFSGALDADQVFRLHWRDDPRKTDEWAKAKKASLAEAWMWASEYEIDYTASVPGICIPGAWVESARRLRALLDAAGIKVRKPLRGIAGLDVGAGGKALSVYVARFGPIVEAPVSRGEPDTTETALWGLDQAEATASERDDGMTCAVRVLRFDEVGVGKGVLSTLTRHGRHGLVTVPVNSGTQPSETEWPDGKSAREKFFNLKAEIWWMCREAIKCSHEMVLHLEGKTADDGGIEHPVEECLLLPDHGAGPEADRLCAQLSVVKSGRNEAGKIVIESKVSLAKRGVPSPDHADALVMTFDPDTSLDDWFAAFGGERRH